MTRLRLTLLYVALISACATSTAADSRVTLAVGTAYTGEFVGDAMRLKGDHALNGLAFYQSHFQVRMRAGQSYRIESTGRGSNSKMSAVLYDSKGAHLTPFPGPANYKEMKKEVVIKFDDAPITGDYTLVITSTHICEFTVKVTELGNEDSVHSLEARRRDLLNELEDVERKLRDRRNQ